LTRGEARTEVKIEDSGRSEGYVSRGFKGGKGGFKPLEQEPEKKAPVE
jgi:hypothetical protein